jgi:hypothetical protein
MSRGRDGDDVFSAGEGDTREGDFVGVDERLADGEEGFGLGVVFGDDEVGLLEEGGVDGSGVDELGDVHGALGGDAEVGELVGLDGDVAAVGVLVAFDDVGFVNRVGGFVGGAFDGAGGDVLMLDALAGAAVDLVEVDVAGGFGGDEKFDAEGDEGNLDFTAPVGTGHGESSCRHDLP